MPCYAQQRPRLYIQPRHRPCKKGHAPRTLRGANASSSSETLFSRPWTRVSSSVTEVPCMSSGESTGAPLSTKWEQDTCRHRRLFISIPLGCRHSAVAIKRRHVAASCREGRSSTCCRMLSWCSPSCPIRRSKRERRSASGVPAMAPSLQAVLRAMPMQRVLVASHNRVAPSAQARAAQSLDGRRACSRRSTAFTQQDPVTSISCSKPVQRMAAVTRG